MEEQTSDGIPAGEEGSVLVRVDAYAGLAMLDQIRQEATSTEALQVYFESLHEKKLTELFACMLGLAADGQLAVYIAAAAQQAMNERGLSFGIGEAFFTEGDLQEYLASSGRDASEVVQHPSLPSTVDEE